ncbi:MAG TPA: hypothetical protein VLA99_05690 [Nitrospiraceae bacterium]|nr:hypothetical protein [Nitrospiraceae bacterium]
MPVWICLLSLLTSFWPGVDARGAERRAVSVIVGDSLAKTDRPVTIEALLVEEGMLRQQGVGGEPLILWVDKVRAATAMTGGDGRAFFQYTPSKLGTFRVRVTVGDSPRVANAEGTGTLAVWERRRPILLVEGAALFASAETGITPALPLPLPLSVTVDKPAEHAVEELERLSQFYYHLLYVVPPGSSALNSVRQYREWLDQHKFPQGVVLPADLTVDGVRSLLERLRADGWENIKSGVGTTAAFAEALVAERLTVVVINEDEKVKLPRKARRAKEWKEARKHLQE